MTKPVCTLVTLLCLTLLLSASVQAFRPLTVTDIYNTPALMAPPLQSPAWAPLGRELVYYQVNSDNHHRLCFAADPATGKSRVVLDLETLRQKNATLAGLAQGGEAQATPPNEIQLSPDETRVLYSMGGDIFEYKLSDGSSRQLTRTPAEEKEVRYSPDGRNVAYVRDYNLYYLDLATGQETTVTKDGNKNLTYGTSDWVIQEELDLDRGYWWSPDSTHLAILRLDESRVPEYPIVDWTPQHPTIEFQKYPKAGDPNPAPALFCFTLASGAMTEIPLRPGGVEYLPRVGWTPDGKQLLVQTLDRDQKRLRLFVANPDTGDSRNVLEEQDNCWVDVHDLVYFLKTRPEFVWGSARDGHMHLYRYHLNGTLLNQVTTGPWEVTEINGVDESSGKVYFTATEKSPTQRHLYSVSLSSGQSRCLSERVGWHRFLLSPDCKAFLDIFSEDLTPPVYTIGLLAEMAKGVMLARIDPALLAPFELQPWEYQTIKAPDGDILYSRMLKPRGFDPTRRYPVIVYVYGGPNAQVVTRQWQGPYQLWHQLMSQHGYIIFSLDNRGSGGRGKVWENTVYLRLCKRELEDQLTGIGYLKSLAFVDPQRIGIWGWSYGGTMTAYALTRAPGVFKAGVAVAPLTDWVDYDTIYTERYLQQPKDNPDGYRNGSPISAAGELQDRLLMVHGTSDDNVHFQNAIRMINALIQFNKKFQILYYPLMTHGISERKARIHLFESITEFFEQNLKEPAPLEKAK